VHTSDGYAKVHTSVGFGNGDGAAGATRWMFAWLDDTLAKMRAGTEHKVRSEMILLPFAMVESNAMSPAKDDPGAAF
jgi:hypothetical protein